MKNSQQSEERLVGMLKGFNILFVTLILCSGVLVGCSAGSQSRQSDPRASASTSSNKPPVAVHIFDVQPAAHSPNRDLLIPAALSVEDTAIVLAEREGRIVNLRGQEGARVKKGEVLAQFNDEEQRGQLRRS